MPRPRPLRTKEEISAVPKDKPVTIDLSPETEENPFEVQSDNKEIIPPSIKLNDNVNTQKAQNETKAKTNNQPDPQDHEDLRQQLEEMRKAKEESDRRIQEEVRARQEMERVARDRENLIRQREQEALRSKTRAEDAEYDAILNAISAAETEAGHAERDIALATETANPQLVAEASRRLARAESRLVQLQDGKEAIERGKTMAKENKDGVQGQGQTQSQRQPTVEEYIDMLPNLMGSQRDWLKRHPDAISDQRKNLKLQAAHIEAEDSGIRIGSEDYYRILEEKLGYRKYEGAKLQEDAGDDDGPPVGAPPSRSATNPATGRPASSRITLSPEQREMAALSGVDEITYARNLQLMEERKRQGLLQ